MAKKNEGEVDPKTTEEIKTEDEIKAKAKKKAEAEAKRRESEETNKKVEAKAEDEIKKKITDTFMIIKLGDKYSFRLESEKIAPSEILMEKGLTEAIAESKVRKMNSR